MGYATSKSQYPEPAGDRSFLEQATDVLALDQPAAEPSPSERDAAYGHITTLAATYSDQGSEAAYPATEPQLDTATAAARLNAAEKRALEPLTDTEILQHMITGDTRCFEILYERHLPGILSFLRHRTAGNEALSQDLAQEAFIRAFNHFQRGDITELTSKTGRGSAAPWLTTTARNLLFDHHDRAHNKHEQLEDFTSHNAAVQYEVDSSPGPEEQVLSLLENQALKAILDQGINELNKVQREVIVARFLDELSVTEAAERLETNYKALTVRQMRAIKSLRKWLAAKNLDESTP